MAVMEVSYIHCTDTELGLEKTNVALVTLVGIKMILQHFISFFLHYFCFSSATYVLRTRRLLNSRDYYRH